MRRFAFIAALSLAVTGALVVAQHGELAAPGERPQVMPAPADTIVFDREEEGGGDEDQRKRWFEKLHRAAPGTDWRAIEKENLLLHARGRDRMTTSFANGAVQGTWVERGAKNQAGRLVALDYFAPKNLLFAISEGGSMFKGTPENAAAGGPRAPQYRFTSTVLKAIPNGSGGVRLIAAIGLGLYYSDDSGSTWNPGSGVTGAVDWGKNQIKQVTALADAGNTLYALAYLWDPTPFAPRYWLFRSTDRGASWSKYYAFEQTVEDNLLMWSNKASTNSVFFLSLESGVAKLFLANNSGVVVRNQSTDLPTSPALSGFKAAVEGTKTIWFALLKGGAVYRSTNTALNWTLAGTAPQGRVLSVSPADSSKLYVADVNAYRSPDGGATWYLVNDWTDYYGDPAAKLHADIYAIEFFRRADNSEFAIVNTDGGAYRSDDGLVTVANISLAGLRNSQYYDVLHDPLNANYLYAGAQDQGFQRANTAATVAGQLSFTQVISGDYGMMQRSRSDRSLWTEYPHGQIMYYHDAHGPLSNSDFIVPGSYKPNVGWMLATARVYPATADRIYIAGGNLTGGDGSFLMRLTPGAGPAYPISATQYGYNFKNRSNTGTAGISAIGSTPLDPQRIYVGTEDGAFFTSTNGGTGWKRTTSFTGPEPYYLTGNSIAASKITPNLVWYGGSGYSNPGVYQSVDGGVTFAPLGTGLPPTLVYDLVTNSSETLLFAATEAGPYVLNFSDLTWYPIGGGVAPSAPYMAADYDAASSTVHFATFARGIWDFKISSQP